MILTKGHHGGASAPPSPSSSLPVPSSLLATVFAPHVRKLLPQACHLQAKHRGIAEVQQLSQSEEHRSTLKAFLQALNTSG